MRGFFFFHVDFVHIRLQILHRVLHFDLVIPNFLNFEMSIEGSILISFYLLFFQSQLPDKLAARFFQRKQMDFQLCIVLGLGIHVLLATDDAFGDEIPYIALPT